MGSLLRKWEAKHMRAKRMGRPRSQEVRGDYIKTEREIPSKTGKRLFDGIEGVFREFRRQGVSRTTRVHVVSGFRRLHHFLLPLVAELHLEVVGGLGQAESGEVSALGKGSSAKVADVRKQSVHFVGRNLLRLGSGLLPLVFVLLERPMAFRRVNLQAL